MGLLAENAMTPRLSEFARARLEMVRSQNNARYDATAMLFRNVARALFGRAHPYGFVNWGLPHTEAIRAEDIAALHADLFRPAHATLVVVGDATASDVERMAQRWFGSWAPKPALPRPALPAPAQEPRVIVVERATGGQTEVAIAARGPSTEKDYLALRLLARLFGGTSSRLRGQVRVEMGAGYAFGGKATVWRSASQLAIYGVFDVAKAPSAVRAMLAAIAEARTRGVRERDLERARTTILAEWRSAALSNQGAAKLAAESIEVGLPLESLAEFPRLMQSITREDVLRVAQRYLAEDSLHVVVVAEKSEHSKFADLGLGPVDARDSWTEPADP
jgi:zinc protease